MSLQFTFIKQRLFQLILIMLIFLPTVSTHADTLESLLMPGPVIEGHKKYEDDCGQCHDPLGDKQQTTLCLDCHKKIKADRSKQEGFHHHEQIKNQSCASCHSDHIGRDADIILLNPEQFDHDLTDYKLKDRHTTVNCDGCHQADTLFRDAPHDCIDCHKDDDIHQGELGKQCKDCHSAASWQKAEQEFDHNETKFKLRGKHKDTDCLSCHVSSTYTQAPKTCYGCHQINDVHNQRYGKDCQDCHQEKGWETIDFNHDETDFKLTGKHQKTACVTCHSGSKKKLPISCVGCHQHNDVHAKRNGDQCKDCHNTRSWKTTFDHDKDSDFHLIGQHQEVACTSCHQGDVKEALPTDCYGCHGHDDVHEQSQGKQCSHCHNETGWFDEVLFDHDVTPFPLVGLHASVSCEDCHSSTNFKDAESRCISCHKQDDSHKQSLGFQCQDCHTPGSWNLWLFDHDTQTDYPLKGKHAGLSCEGCHQQAVINNEFDTPDDCVDCHRKDDIHNGRFGNQCDRCHDNDDFENFIFKAQ